MEKIALLPGGFKPPHAGHYNMAKWLAANTDADSVIIKVGSKERGGITREISLKLWDLYREHDKQADANKIAILPSESPSPVRDVYDFIEQEAPENSTVYLGMGEKDINDQRFANISKFAEPKGIEFQTVLVPPQAGGVSGTEMRQFIQDGNKDSFQSFLPNHLNSEQKDEAWDIVSSLEELYNNPQSGQQPYSDTTRYRDHWKSNVPGPKDDIPRKGDQIHNRQKTRGVVYEQQGGKTLRVYDFDDTLAVTKGANIKVKHADGSIDVLNPAEFATYAEQEGDKFDFTEFDRVIKDAEPIQNIVSMLEKDLQTTAKVTILTARLMAYPVRRYLRTAHDLDAYVVAVGSSDPKDKANWIKNHIEKGYNDILFIDDSEKNRNAVLNLKNEYPDIKLDVQDPDSIKEWGATMNNQELAKHNKKLKRFKKDLKKFHKTNRYHKSPSYLKHTHSIPLYENIATINNQSIPLEIMNTPEMQTQGMIGRNNLEGGMLFPYNEPGERSFHMKGCKIPLDIIFITNGSINQIEHNVPPCEGGWCPQYKGIGDNVLELPGGSCEERGINIGDEIKLPIMTNETNIFTKEWWKKIITEQLLTEGGAAGHMAHPFNLDSVKTGKDLIDIFTKSADSLQNNPGAVKIDGVNSSIRLVDLDGQKQFVMDRGSKKELDIRGITKADLEDRFGEGHGMIKVGGAVLDMFNEALPNLENDLKALRAWDNPNILFNMEYVSGRTNVQQYESNFIAIHGLMEIKNKEVEGKRGPLIKRVASEISYNDSDLQSLLDNLAPIAKEKGFEVYGSVPTEMKQSPNFNSALSKNYTVVSNEGKESKSLDQWLSDVSDIPGEEFIFMNVDNSQKKVGAVSKQVYIALLQGENIDELFETDEDKKKAIDGFVIYLATEKLGDEILKVLDSPMGSVEDHEGVVIRDKNISNEPFKITGKFILGGLETSFR